MSDHVKPLSRERLTDGDVNILKPAGWWGDGGKLFRVFEFGRYPDAVAFALRVAQLAEEQDHHPDIHIFYDKVKVNYFTHDRGGVTMWDIRGARDVNALHEQLTHKPETDEAISEPVS